jgi:hypothetical protein
VRALLEFAMLNEVLYTLEELQSSYPMLKDGGAESALFYDAEGYVLKAVDYSIYSATPESFLSDRVLLHNALFPESAYEVVGYMIFEGIFRFLLRQPIIDEQPYEYEELIEYMSSLGFRYEKISPSEMGFTNECFVISDAHTGNVLKGSDGNFYFIDEIIMKK